MILYRITREKYLKNYQGRGKSFEDGARWNLPNYPILYFGSSPSVALLELANYLPSPKHVPRNYKLGIYELPDSISNFLLPKAKLPPNWDDFPYPTSTQIIGSQWLDKNQELCLIVPSVAVPKGLESNYILNPNHPEISKIKLTQTLDELYNPRAFKSLT